VPTNGEVLEVFNFASGGVRHHWSKGNTGAPEKLYKNYLQPLSLPGADT
jgi:predicted metallopeptidase